MEARGIHRRSAFSITADAVKRFQAKWQKHESGCWLWIASTRNGYGAFGCGGSVVSAHVFSYVLAHGDLHPGHVVRHTCDVKLCVNPDHLLAGTPLDNFNDAKERGRVVRLRGEQLPQSVLTTEAVRLIKAIRILRGYGAVRIARAVGYSTRIVDGVLHRGNWRHIPTPTLDEARQIIATQLGAIQ